MDRRESLKLLLLAAAGAPDLLRGTGLSAQSAGFSSRWHQWRDMDWAGPELWGNRLQDWGVRRGVMTCRSLGNDRTLHCLTYRVGRPDFWTEVTMDAWALGEVRRSPDLVGIRLGVKGRFEGYRSAAVHGTGLDVGVRPSGHLTVAGVQGPRVPLSGPLTLGIRGRTGGAGASLDVTVSGKGGAELATVRRSDLDPARLIGNLALVSHREGGGEGSGRPDDGSVVAAFSHWRIGGEGVDSDSGAELGPVMFAQYTLHRNVLKLTAQLAPIDRIEGVQAVLEVVRDGDPAWTRVGTTGVDFLSRTARFRVEGWDGSRAARYRVLLRVPMAEGLETFGYEGTVAAEPRDRPLRAAVFSCNADHGFPDTEVVRHVTERRPDLCLFLGDQFYEGSGGFGIQTDSVEAAALDMLHKWYMFGWSYRDLFRHVPAAFIPDDHDVYHGNVWGEGGKAAPTDQGWGAVAQDQGGYKMPPAWVNAVQRAQTSHLPDPNDPTPVEQGIGVYYTGWDYGGVSFALLEDRKFKSAPGGVLPSEAQVLNGWIQNPEFDVREHRDLPEASLLGARQMSFLEDWAGDWRGPSYMKVVLSQTNFAAVHTIPAEAMSGAVLPGLPVPKPGDYVRGDKLAVDMDSNGWPAARRDEALEVLRTCAAFHIAGDQHLATMVQHGIQRFGDAAFSFTGPALNNIWPRRWWPPTELRERALEGGPEYAGDFRDGFGNRVTVHAAANPRDTGLEPRIIRDRSTGYGIVVFDPEAGRIRVECWPRHVDPGGGDEGQYPGWPMEIAVQDGDGRVPEGQVEVEVGGLEDPVVQVRDREGVLVYARRLRSNPATIPLHGLGDHLLRVGDPDRGLWQERSVRAADGSSGAVRFDFSAVTS